MTKTTTLIKPPTGSGKIDFKDIWEYRELAWMLLLRDIKVRYKQTVLGVAWAVIQPITMMLIFTFIFGRLAKIPSDGIPYPIFVFSGLLAWNFFSSAVSSGGVSMLGAAGMISKVYFPRMIVPLASIGVSMVDFLVSFLLLVLLMLFYSVQTSWQILYFPFFMFGLLLSALGVSCWLSAITVSYRDFRFVIPFMMQIWMYITPVIYPLSFIPEQWRWLAYLNPVFGWVDAIRASLLASPIDWSGVTVSALWTLVILFIGMRFFKRSERRFADVI